MRIKSYRALLFCFLTVLFIIPLKVSANSINYINMDVFIEQNGTAKVTEVWDVNTSSGTEIYKPYGNLEDSVISNFKVVDETGRQFTKIDNWDINATLSEKAYRSGMRNTGDGIELNFGMSSYGHHTYTLTYEISNFVKQLNDSQMIYFGLMPSEMNPSPEKVQIKIISDIIFNTENAKIWSYGYEGTVNFVNGGIELVTNQGLDSQDYMVLLTKFNNNTFTLTNKIDAPFSDYQELAAKGTKAPWYVKIFDFIIVIFQFILFGGIAIFASMYGKYFSNKKRTTSDTKLPPIKQVNYFREIPADKDLIKAYWLSETYQIGGDKSGLLGAILLKWLRLNYIEITKTKKGIFDFKDNNYAIDLQKIPVLTDEVEQSLLDMLKISSGDGILETKEFVKWSKTNYEKVLDWFSKAKDAGYQKYLLENKIIEQVETKKILFFDKELTSYEITPEVREQGEFLLGLKRFLLDYSMIPDKPVMEVKLWEDYLIFASILGVADKVSEQFSKLYPQFSELSNLNVDTVTPAIIMFSHAGYNSAYNASVSTGSGGSSFSGGGDGSFGGSSGGGFR